MSLQRRVTLALVGVVVLFITVQGTVAYLSLEEQEDTLVEDLLRSEAQQLAARAERGELAGPRALEFLAPRPNLSAWLVPEHGAAVPAPPPPRLRSLGDGLHRLGGSVEHLHVVVMPTAGGRLFVQYDAWQNEAQVEQFGLYLLGLGALCIALSFAVSRALARIVTQPIERVAARLSAWAPDSAAPPAPASDEEGRLLEAFDRMQARFEQALADEREFTANVSHEIRTPLAALRTDIEMLGLSPQLPAAHRARLDRAMLAIEAMTGALQSARVLSRRTPVVARPVDLSRCVDDAWLSLGLPAQDGAVQFVNEVPPGTEVIADRHALLTILRNLLRNAAEHAAPTRCIVRRTASGLEIEDDGLGIPVEDQPFVFERYWRGRRLDSPGTRSDADRGLGLAIAKQLADLNGWQLGIEPAPERGTRFRLELVSNS